MSGEELIEEYQGTKSLTSLPTKLFKCLGRVHYIVILAGIKDQTENWFFDAKECLKDSLRILQNDL